MGNVILTKTDKIKILWYYFKQYIVLSLIILYGIFLLFNFYPKIFLAVCYLASSTGIILAVKAFKNREINLFKFLLFCYFALCLATRMHIFIIDGNKNLENFCAINYWLIGTGYLIYKIIDFMFGKDDLNFNL